MRPVYKAIAWNKHKFFYDICALLGINLYIFVYIYGSLLLDQNANFITLRIRALGSVSFFLLHVILSIGPLSRIDSRFLPLLYNRRHIGVMLFILSCIHFYFVIGEYHKWGVLEPYVNIFLGNVNYLNFTQFPFQVLGVCALFIFGLMFITSHDFWLHILGVAFFKSLHMLVYIAYVLTVLHVLLGPLQFESNEVLIFLTFAGMLWMITIHLWAALAGKRNYNNIMVPAQADSDGYISTLVLADDIEENKARPVVIDNIEMAIYRYKQQFFAVAGLCPHQNGPIAEGEIVNGCITCPWHGFQFDPNTGKSPPPYDDCIDTYPVKIVNDVVYIHPVANPRPSL